MEKSTLDELLCMCVCGCVCLSVRVSGYLSHIHRPDNVIVIVHCIDLDSITEQGRAFQGVSMAYQR